MSLGIGLNPDDPELKRRLEQMRMAKERTIPEISGPSSHGGWPGAIVYGAGQAIGKGADMVGKAWKGELSPQEAAEGSFDVATAGIGGPSGALMAGGSKTLPLIKEALPELAQTYSGPSVKAYHGSPHDFERFDISKIGTGEGAQAYGHGLYFAENEGIARHYRDNLTAAHTKFSHPTYGELDLSGADTVFEKEIQRISPTLPPTKAGEIATNIVEGLRGGDDLAHMQKFVRQSDWDSEEKQAWLAALDRAKEFTVNKPKGHMYEVEIQADPEHFLDWDKPLSEQKLKTEAIDPVLSRAVPSPKNPQPYTLEELSEMGATGRDLYDRLSWATGRPSKAFPEINIATPSEASNALREAGIPGIKYLDQGSRGAGEGSRNYVVFSDELIKLARKYGIPLGVLGGFGAMGGIPEDKRPRA